MIHSKLSLETNEALLLCVYMGGAEITGYV